MGSDGTSRDNQGLIGAYQGGIRATFNLLARIGILRDEEALVGWQIAVKWARRKCCLRSATYLESQQGRPGTYTPN